MDTEKDTQDRRAALRLAAQNTRRAKEEAGRMAAVARTYAKAESALAFGRIKPGEYNDRVAAELDRLNTYRQFKQENGI